MSNAVPAAVPALISLWPQAGRILGLSRQATYRAAQAGSLPVFPGSGRKKVITAKLEAQIGRSIRPDELAGA